MTNDDLKRFYNVNEKSEQNKDFVRYGSNGEIISEHDATKDEEVVNYRTLMQHASGGGDKLYRHNIKFSNSYFSCGIVIDTRIADVFTTETFANYLQEQGYTSNNTSLQIFTRKYEASFSSSLVFLTGIYSETNSSPARIKGICSICKYTLSDGVLTFDGNSQTNTTLTIAQDMVNEI